MLIKLLIFVGLVSTSFQLSTPNDSTYVAGVVEIPPEPPFSLTQLNFTKYITILNTAKLNNADITVFPEGVISNDSNAVMYIPEASQNSTPCDDFSTIDLDGALLRAFSCAARQAETYLVLNLREKIRCLTMCANTGPFVYHSTNVVFNRNGTVISKYRSGTTNYYEIGIFTTDFGVTFGHVTGMDLVSKNPITEILKRGITDIICPMAWKSQLPFLTALQIQQNWAYKHNVNLLVAGLNDPKSGLTGSGIYAGRFGPLVSSINENGYQAYFENVPKTNFPLNNTCKVYVFDTKNTPEKMAQFSIDQENLKQYHTHEINLNVTINQTIKIIKDTICHNQLCCNIWMKIRNPGQALYQYRMVAFDGVQQFAGNNTKGLSVCGIVACKNSSLESCGAQNFTIRSQNMIFEQIFINGQFEGLDDILTLPSSVDFDFMPYDPIDFNYIESYDYSYSKKWWKNITYELVNPKSNILTFAIYGRNFRKDGWIANGHGSGNYMHCNIFVIFSTIIISILSKVLLV